MQEDAMDVPNPKYAYGIRSVMDRNQKQFVIYSQQILMFNDNGNLQSSKKRPACAGLFR